MYTIIQSSVMIFLLMAFLIFLMLRLAGIKKYNVLILSIMVMMWISFGLLSVTVIRHDIDSLWQWPLLLFIPQFVQAIIRIPLGILSQKLVSRKKVIILTSIIMMVFAIPLMAEVTYTTLIIASIGLGVFGATYGMQNQYWSENWNIRNVFISTGIVFIAMFIGKNMGYILVESFTIDFENVKWIIVAAVVVNFIALTVYILFNKERTETILLDNQESYAQYVSKFRVKEILIFSSLIFFVNMAVNLASNDVLVQGSNPTLLKATISTVTIIAGLLVAFIFVRTMIDRHIEFLSILISLFGLVLMAISSFAVKSMILSYVGVLILSIGCGAYTMNQMGMILHIDHKNSLLVLGIWLTFKSLSAALGTVTVGEIKEYAPESAKYLIFVSMGLLVSSFITSLLVYKKYTLPAYNLIEELEYAQNHDKNMKTWK